MGGRGGGQGRGPGDEGGGLFAPDKCWKRTMEQEMNAEREGETGAPPGSLPASPCWNTDIRLGVGQVHLDISASQTHKNTHTQTLTLTLTHTHSLTHTMF